MTISESQPQNFLVTGYASYQIQCFATPNFPMHLLAGKSAPKKKSFKQKFLSSYIFVDVLPILFISSWEQAVRPLIEY